MTSKEHHDRRKLLARIGENLDRLADNHLGWQDETDLVDAKILVRGCFDRTPGVRMSLEDFAEKLKRDDRESYARRKARRAAAR